ncbi:MAG: hypothetical protein PVI33_06225 [Candidatus Omnitrophota bacterium]|jgi:hypothetical protein
MFADIPLPENTQQIIIAVIIFLFIVWLIHRIENRIKSLAQNAVYDKFPFLKKAVDSFEAKLEFLSKRVDAIEDRIFELEKNKTKNI